MRAMKPLFVFAMPLLLSGCASDLSPEERDFFYRGWTHPERAAQERMYGRKNATALNPDDTARHPAPDAPNQETADGNFRRVLNR